MTVGGYNTTTLPQFDKTKHLLKIELILESVLCVSFGSIVRPLTQTLFKYCIEKKQDKWFDNRRKQSTSYFNETSRVV